MNLLEFLKQEKVFGIVRSDNVDSGIMIAQAYIDAFNSAVISAEAGSQNAVKNYLSTIDTKDLSQVVEAMDYMRSSGVSSNAMKEYWDAATTGSTVPQESILQ